MSGSHTPGPWRLDGLGIEAGFGKTICVMGESGEFGRGYTPCKNHKANALLIAAAPDLFEALKFLDAEIMEWLPESAEGDVFKAKLICRIDAVLSKAKD